jgi:hypothetical protein
MNNGDLKVYLVNLATFGISMSTLETALKILLLMASIGYTAQRWYYLRKQGRKVKDDQE